MLFIPIKRFFYTFFIFLAVSLPLMPLKASVHESYTNALCAEEKQLLDTIVAVFGLSFDEWNQFKNQYAAYNYSDYEQREIAAVRSRCAQEVSPALKQKIMRVLAQSPLKRPITIVRDNSPSGSDIVALQNTLIIDEDRFNTIYREEDHVHAIIWHEIIHILKEDDLIIRALHVLRDLAINTATYSGFNWLSKWAHTVGIHYNEERWQAAIAPWYLFREKRADLMSGLAHSANAQALTQVFKKFGSCAAERHDQLHPCMKDRIAYMSQLASKLVP